MRAAAVPAGNPALKSLTLWLYVAVLAWAPFPLGSNRLWSLSLLALLIAGCWLLWGLGATRQWQELRRLWPALLLGGLALLWGTFQACGIGPSNWDHPLWRMAEELLGQPLEGSISLNPWRSGTALLKLGTVALALLLTYAIARDRLRAARLLSALTLIGAAYAIYALALAATGYVQFELFYTAPAPRAPLLTGPFVLHNSYATFAGLIAIAALAQLWSELAERFPSGRRPGAALLSALGYLSGPGLAMLLAFVLAFATMVGAASRAGFVATVVGVAALVLVSLVAPADDRTAGRGAFIALLLVSLGVLMVALTGDVLAQRLSALVDAGGDDAIRAALWHAAGRMIADAPFLGLGLGSFEDAYPLYATEVFPYVMDKAHNDYLEFAAGLGLPAALAWWGAMAWLFLLCLRGCWQRQRDVRYARIAVGSTVLVAVHSAFDFSLQIPAVALWYATLLGLGASQSFSRRPVPGALHGG